MTNYDFWKLTGEQPVEDMDKISDIFFKNIEKYQDDSVMTRRLQVSYKTAMDKVFNEKVKPAVDELVREIDKVYSDINTRFDIDQWDKILDNAILDSRFAFVYARNEIIAYLLYHEYVSVKIWNKLDDKLSIMKDYDKLKRTFPVTFMHRIKNVLNDEALFDYENIKLLNDNAVNPDRYIHDLFELADMIEYGGNGTKIKKLIKKLENADFYHIFLDAEKLNYIVSTSGSEDEAEELCRKLRDDENIYIQSCYANGLWYIGRSDEADAVWQKILEDTPDYGKALIGHTRWLFENEYYEQAKNCIFSAIEVMGETDDAMKLLDDINEIIMKHHLDMYEENPDNLYDGVQYAWCLCQSGRWDDAIEFLLDMEEDESVSYDINMLLGRAYFSKEDYKNAIPYLQKWIKQTMLLPCDGSEEYKERMERYPGALAVMSECCYETGDMKKAVYFMEQSMHAYDDDDEEKLRAMTRLADFYNEIGRYREAFELSGEVIKRDDSCVWAYFAHQIAAFETHNTSEVINDYAALVNFAPEATEPYVYAATVYMFNNMFDDMELVIDRAESNGVKSPKLSIMRYIIAVARADISELLDVEEDFDSMCSKNKSLLDETNIIVRFYITIKNKYIAVNDFENAMEYNDRIIELEPNNPYHMWSKADLYFRYDYDKKALEAYQSVGEELRDNTGFLCDYASCMQYNDMWEESADILNEVLSREDTGMADMYMERYYQHLYSESDARVDYKKARSHIDAQIKKMPDNMFAVYERVRLILGSEDNAGYDVAVNDCELLLENEYGNSDDIKKNEAELYIKKGEIQKALKTLESVSGDDKNSRPTKSVYKLAAEAYTRADRTDLAEEILRKGYKKTKNPYYIMEIANACLKNGNYGGAARWYKKYLPYDKDGVSAPALIKAYLLNKNKSEARRQIRKLMAECSKKTALTVLRSSWHIFNYMLDAETALCFAEKATEYMPKNKRFECYTALAIFSRYINDDKRARRYSKKLLDEMIKRSGSIEADIDVMYGRRDRIDNVVAYYIGLGDFDKAEEYANMMLKDTGVCVWCNAPCCVDAYERLVLIKLMRGDFSGMKRVCKKLLEKNKNNTVVKTYLENIDKLKSQHIKYFGAEA